MNYSPYASQVAIYLGFVVCAFFFVCVFVLASHTATFLEEPVARRKVSRLITTLALGGPEPFLRLLLYNEGSSLYFYLFYF